MRSTIWSLIFSAAILSATILIAHFSTGCNFNNPERGMELPPGSQGKAGSGAASFRVYRYAIPGVNPTGLATLDAYGHGLDDIAILATSSSSFSIFRNLGNGLFKVTANFLTCASPDGIDADDFSGDGYVDILVTCGDQSVLSLFLGNGRGQFTRRDLNVSAHPIGVQAVTGAGRGNPRMVILHDQPSQLEILSNRGNGNFITSKFLEVSSQPIGFSVDTFTPEKAASYAVVSLDQSLLSVYLNRGKDYARFDYKTLGSPDSLETFDFRHIGVSDIFVSSSTTGTFRIYLNDGNGKFSHYQDYELPLATASGPGTSHLRGREQEELLFQSSLNGDIVIYPILGAGHLGPPEIIRFDGALTGMSTGHFIHSSDDMDMAMIDTSTSELVIYLNERANY